MAGAAGWWLVAGRRRLPLPVATKKLGRGVSMVEEREGKRGKGLVREAG